ncbi:TSUP family transporter [Desulfobulbus alkaliphilus]|uniref:TSUP family transporter n=1 Tax=Desulfobulbus alkaliphilus TaxID=869814 RepID=UPI001966B180|nr:sulfite exporter TauE/SafE family protein [Desulfobulbus alkaliphilus]
MSTFLFASLIFLFAGIVQGLTGFGAGLLAIPLLCLVMDVKSAVSLCILSTLIISTTMAYDLRRLLDHRKILPLLLGSLPGVVVGTMLLRMVDQGLIKNLLGILLVGVSCLNLLFSPRALNPSLIWGYLAGFLSGVINALLAAGGPPAIIYTTLHDWKKDEIKATLTGFFMLVGYYTAGVHTFSGLIDTRILSYFAVTLPFVFAGTIIGSRISERINRRLYVQVVYGVLMVLGLLMLVK